MGYHIEQIFKNKKLVIEKVCTEYHMHLHSYII